MVDEPNPSPQDLRDGPTEVRDDEIACHGRTLADVKRGILRIDDDGWIRIDPKDPATFPALGQSVALVNVDRWENCGGDMRRNVHDCGYLNDAGCVHPYWSIRSDRPQEISAYTHWFPLPEAPGLHDEE